MITCQRKRRTLRLRLRPSDSLRVMSLLPHQAGHQIRNRAVIVVTVCGPGSKILGILAEKRTVFGRTGNNASIIKAAPLAGIRDSTGNICCRCICSGNYGRSSSWERRRCGKSRMPGYRRSNFIRNTNQPRSAHPPTPSENLAVWHGKTALIVDGFAATSMKCFRRRTAGRRLRT